MMDLRFERHNSHARSRLQITNPATHEVPCLVCTGESNCPQLAKNNLILRQCKWSRREDTPPTASEVANMDMVEVLLACCSVACKWRCLLSFAAVGRWLFSTRPKPTRRIFWRSQPR